MTKEEKKSYYNAASTFKKKFSLNILVIGNPSCGKSQLAVWLSKLGFARLQNSFGLTGIYKHGFLILTWYHWYRYVGAGLMGNVYRDTDAKCYSINPGAISSTRCLIIDEVDKSKPALKVRPGVPKKVFGTHATFY